MLGQNPPRRLCVYSVHSLIKAKFHLSSINTHLSAEVCLWFCFVFFSSSCQICPLILFGLQPNRVTLHFKVDYFNKQPPIDKTLFQSPFISSRLAFGENIGGFWKLGSNIHRSDSWINLGWMELSFILHLFCFFQIIPVYQARVNQRLLLSIHSCNPSSRACQTGASCTNCAVNLVSNHSTSLTSNAPKLMWFPLLPRRGETTAMTQALNPRWGIYTVWTRFKVFVIWELLCWTCKCCLSQRHNMLNLFRQQHTAGTFLSPETFPPISSQFTPNSFPF